MVIKRFIKYIMALVGAYILVSALAKAIEIGYVSYQIAGVILLALGIFGFFKWKRSLCLDEMYVPIQFIKD